jgi:hypothetical protein
VWIIGLQAIVLEPRLFLGNASEHLIDPRPAGEVPRPQFAFLRQASNES